MRLALVVLAAAACGCSVVHRVDVTPPGAPKRWVCLDGLPVRVLVDVRCADGVCGYTCAPARWTADDR
jgi:hypothetical protein